MSEQPKLGKIIVEHWNVGRDAVHVPIVPVIASEELQPGQQIGLTHLAEGEVSSSAATKIGIVDPFLGAPVKLGERFYMCLYPGSIISMRHEWQHPEFYEGSGYYGLEPLNTHESAEWLQKFASHWGMDYHVMLRGAMYEGGIAAQGRSIYSWNELDPEQKALFWYHLERVAGRKFNDEHRENTYFSCSC